MMRTSRGGRTVLKRALISTTLFIAIGVAALLVASSSHTSPDKPATTAKSVP